MFTQWCFYTQSVALEVSKSQFYHSFCRSNLILCERVRPEAFADRTSFCTKGLGRKLQNRNFTLGKVLSIEPHFVRKGWAGPVKIAILLQFLTIEPHFVQKGCDRHSKAAILHQILTIATDTRQSQLYLSF